MNAIPPSFEPAATVTTSTGVVDAIEARWTALVQAAEVVAVIAGTTERAVTAHCARDFGGLRRDRESWRRERTRVAIGDLSAIMETGLSTLLAIQQRGVDPAPAAEALWEEFTAACGSILALLPPGTRTHPRDEY